MKKRYIKPTDLEFNQIVKFNNSKKDLIFYNITKSGQIKNYKLSSKINDIRNLKYKYFCPVSHIKVLTQTLTF